LAPVRSYYAFGYRGFLKGYPDIERVVFCLFGKESYELRNELAQLK
jgi:hypothetical protein